MISLVNASKRFGPKLLFEGVNWLITPQDRVGLVGANGTGKSTVMKILAGLETIDSGDVTTQKGITAGYLPQDGLNLSGRTVFEECLSVFDHIRDMEREMEQLAHAMSELDPTSESARAEFFALLHASGRAREVAAESQKTSRFSPRCRADITLAAFKSLRCLMHEVSAFFNMHPNGNNVQKTPSVSGRRMACSVHHALHRTPYCAAIIQAFEKGSCVLFSGVGKAA